MKLKVLCLLVLTLFHAALWAKEQRFDSAKEERAYHQLLKELRCVTCSNQSVDDSKAPIAEAMQEEVYRRLKAGESQDEIKQFLQEHYGDYVLYRPPFEKQNKLLWLAPLTFLLLGFVGWMRWRK